jgi:hypothetical protein
MKSLFVGGGYMANLLSTKLRSSHRLWEALANPRGGSRHQAGDTPGFRKDVTPFIGMSGGLRT